MGGRWPVTQFTTATTTTADIDLFVDKAFKIQIGSQIINIGSYFNNNVFIHIGNEIFKGNISLEMREYLRENINLLFQDFIKDDLSNYDIIMAIKDNWPDFMFERHKYQLGELFITIRKYDKNDTLIHFGKQIMDGIISSEMREYLKKNIRLLQKKIFLNKKRKIETYPSSSFGERPPKKFKIHYTDLS